MAKPNVGDYIAAAWHRFPLGITVISSLNSDGTIHGLSTERAMSVSLNPPMVLFYLGRKKGTYENIMREERFGMNILGADQLQWSEYFSTKPLSPDRPGNLKTAPSGMPIIEDCIVSMDCKLVHMIPTGTNTNHGLTGPGFMVIGEVTDMEVKDGFPLILMEGSYLAVVTGPD
jgi:flavin reductase (DIM6/NTAB) family NADH-FMN oxidoreductase RutF